MPLPWPPTYFITCYITSAQVHRHVLSSYGQWGMMQGTGTARCRETTVTASRHVEEEFVGFPWARPVQYR